MSLYLNTRFFFPLFSTFEPAANSSLLLAFLSFLSFQECLDDNWSDDEVQVVNTLPKTQISVLPPTPAPIPSAHLSETVREQFKNLAEGRISTLLNNNKDSNCNDNELHLVSLNPKTMFVFPRNLHDPTGAKTYSTIPRISFKPILQPLSFRPDSKNVTKLSPTKKTTTTTGKKPVRKRVHRADVLQPFLGEIAEAVPSNFEGPTLRTSKQDDSNPDDDSMEDDVFEP
jgi:hypothetical protein